MDYRATLDNLLKQVDETWLAELTEDYVDSAHRLLDVWRNKLAPRVWDANKWGEAVRPKAPPRWVRCTTTVEDEWGRTRRSGNPYHWEADEEGARADARTDWAAGREQFIYRNTKKLEAATAGRPDPAVEASVRWRGVVEGELTLTFDDGAVLRTRTRLKHNWSVLGNPYIQYPTIFWLDGAHKGLKWLEKNFARPVATDRNIPDKVEGAKALKAASTLAYNLTNRDHLEKVAANRRMRGYMVDTRGPQGTITRARNALGLPKDVTAEEAMDLLVRSLDGTLRERLVAVAKTGQEGEARAPLGKKGKAQRDANKTLEYLELVYRSSKVKVNGWGSDVAERVAAPQKA